MNTYQVEVNAENAFEAIINLNAMLGTVGNIPLRRTDGKQIHLTPALRSLTKAELRVLHMISDGLRTPEIARSLGRSRKTIEVLRYRVLRKLGVTNAQQAVRMFLSVESGELFHREQLRPLLAGLSNRQFEAAMLVAEGLTRKQAAVRMGVTFKTIDTFMVAVYERTGRGSRADLVRYLFALMDGEADPLLATPRKVRPRKKRYNKAKQHARQFARRYGVAV